MSVSCWWTFIKTGAKAINTFLTVTCPEKSSLMTPLVDKEAVTNFHSTTFEW
jgi:hypothetical protein